MYASVARTTTGARTWPRSVTTTPGRSAVAAVRSYTVTPRASTARASPRTSAAGCTRAQCGVNAAPRTPAAVIRSPTSAADSQRVSVSPQSWSSVTCARILASCAGEVASVSVPPLAYPQSIRSAATTRPTSSTVSTIAACRSTAAARPAGPPPAARATASGDAAKSAEHQPPLRPDAPKPAISRSTTAIRSDGSARAR